VYEPAFAADDFRDVGQMIDWGGLDHLPLAGRGGQLPTGVGEARRCVATGVSMCCARGGPQQRHLPSFITA
jgi:hypothetical protein